MKTNSHSFNVINVEILCEDDVINRRVLKVIDIKKIPTYYNIVSILAQHFVKQDNKF